MIGIPKKPAPISDEDKRLVDAIQAGDKTAFDILVLRHKDRIFNLCYWFLSDYEEANDAAQEVFLKAYRSVSKFRFESTFYTWLYRITVNVCKNRLKSSFFKYRRRMIPLENPGGGQHGAKPLEIPDDSPSPMSRLEQKEKMAIIKAAMDTLTAEQRTVLVLRDIQGLSYEEIADSTDLNLGTVKSRLARARLALKEKLRRISLNGV